MCSGSTIFTSLKESGLRPGQWACFPGGGGGVGIQGVQLAVAMGFRPVVVDTGAERKALAEEMGAEAFVDFKEVEDPVARVLEITGGGAHGVFVTGRLRPYTYPYSSVTKEDNSYTVVPYRSVVLGPSGRRHSHVVSLRT
jgi:D-arabinose 1-dehydrogenase-like Zn-dependent alcohol dehydrogenase